MRQDDNTLYEAQFHHPGSHQIEIRGRTRSCIGGLSLEDSGDLRKLPDDLPVPEDDGGCSHLTGMALPRIRLASTGGGTIDAGDPALGRCVFFFYPRTGVPGVPSPEGWDSIPGARGCTPQSCAYREAHGRFGALGYRIFGVSSQTAEEQLEFAGREHIQYDLLSDNELRLAGALSLPTFKVREVARPLIRRVTVLTDRGIVVKTFYPVFPPDRNAAEVLEFIISGRVDGG